MQYSNLKSILKGRLARFSGSTGMDQYIMPELNASMEEFEEEAFLPWFLRQKLEVTFTSGTMKADLPAAFIREYLEDTEDAVPQNRMWASGGSSSYIPLARMDEHPLYSGLLTPILTDPGQPTRYYIDQSDREIYLDRWTDGEYNTTLLCYGSGDRYTVDTGSEPAATAEPKWAKYAPGYLIAYTGMRLAGMYLKNDNAAAIFSNAVGVERRKLIVKNTAINEGAISPNASN